MPTVAVGAAELTECLVPQVIEDIPVELYVPLLEFDLIRELRSRYHLTQAALAALAGVHRTYLSRVEWGRVTPSIFTLIQIAGAVGVEKVTLRVRVPPTRS